MGLIPPDISKIEMIQHRAACFVLKKSLEENICDSVSSMLTDQQWPSLYQLKVCQISITNYLPTNLSLIDYPTTFNMI